MNRYDFYPGDYQRDTADLTIVEDGIYRRLLDWYYSNERPIPDDRATNIVRAISEEERKKTHWVLSRFFKSEPSGSGGEGISWRSERCDREIEKARKRINAAKENGKLGGRPKKKTQQKPNPKPSRNPVGNPGHNPNHNPAESSPSPSDLYDPSLRSGSPNTDHVSTQEDNSPSQLLPIPTSEGSKTKTKIKKASKGGKVWDAYSAAYRQRYGDEPVRNAKTNALCCRMVDLLGADESPSVAAYYLTSNYRWYVQTGHALDSLVKDAQKLRTEWRTGRRVTAAQAHEKDRLQETGDVWRSVKAKRGEP
jgi:uncharacterized protein YdaU (DUF1376 family)